MTTTDNVQATLEEALTWLADIDRQSWAGWVVYLLEVLQDKTDPDEYRAMLLTLQDAIRTRLDDGKW